MKRITLTQINIYPIKSTRGISLAMGTIDKRGLQFDRRWMIVDAEGVFITQREYPRLALISTALAGDAIAISAPGMPVLQLPVKRADAVARRVRVWSDIVTAADMGDDAAAWCSRFLGADCRLVFMPDSSVRKVDGRYAVNSENHVSFTDGYPFLLISEESLSDLNSRMTKPVPMNRFRPSLVVAGCCPFAEDDWDIIHIGDVVFHVAKPCARCAITTVDQSAGTTGREPLATLATYRKRKGHVYFGQNLIHASEGTIRLGDIVHVEHMKMQPQPRT